jgi:hypothetical protein
MTNRPHVHVRLRSLKLPLRHGKYLSEIKLFRYDAFFITTSATLFGTSMYFANSIV